MSDPTRLHKPYTTGARPSTRAAKNNVHMTAGGWVRTIVADDYAWAGNNNTSADPEVLVAGSAWTAETGWYAYSFWPTQTPSEATPVVITVHVHFDETVTVTGNPTITITNTKAGSGTATTLTATFTTLHANKHRMYFVTAVPSANQLKENDVLYIGLDALALAGGTIKDELTSTNTIITGLSDVGFEGSVNRGGNMTIANVATTNTMLGARLKVAA